jgi:hypothetical protein
VEVVQPAPIQPLPREAVARRQAPAAIAHRTVGIVELHPLHAAAARQRHRDTAEIVVDQIVQRAVDRLGGQRSRLVILGGGRRAAAGRHLLIAADVVSRARRPAARHLLFNALATASIRIAGHRRGGIGRILSFNSAYLADR